MPQADMYYIDHRTCLKQRVWVEEYLLLRQICLEYLMASFRSQYWTNRDIYTAVTVGAVVLAVSAGFSTGVLFCCLSLAFNWAILSSGAGVGVGFWVIDWDSWGPGGGGFLRNFWLAWGYWLSFYLLSVLAFWFPLPLPLPLPLGLFMFLRFDKFFFFSRNLVFNLFNDKLMNFIPFLSFF